MGLHEAAVSTLRSKRVWLWEIIGAVIYGIPVIIRFVTRSVVIPILNFPGFWVWYIIPGNFVEKLIVNAFFPGGAGGVAGETFMTTYRGAAPTGRNKYLSRLAGALLQTTIWALFQFWGYSLLINMPGGGNIFESILVFPINFILAAFSIFTPDVVNLAKSTLKNSNQK